MNQKKKKCDTECSLRQGEVATIQLDTILSLIRALIKLIPSQLMSCTLITELHQMGQLWLEHQDVTLTLLLDDWMASILVDCIGIQCIQLTVCRCNLCKPCDTVII